MKTIITICLFCLFASPAIALQPLPTAADSIIARLPQLRGEEKLDALTRLISLTHRYPVVKQYYRMVIDEARLINDVKLEGWAWTQLTGIYYAQFDTDSLFIVGEEAIRFLRQHKQYDDMFFVKQQFIRRYQSKGMWLTAIRKAEEAYNEAKELQHNRSMAIILSAIASIYHNMEQYEEAIRYHTESIEAAEKDRTYRDIIFIQQYYNLAWMARYLNNPHEMLRYADSLYVETERLREGNPGFDVQIYCYFELFHRAIAYSEMNQTQKALQTIHRAEAIYNPRWGENNRYYEVKLDDMYGVYYRAVGNYDKALEHIDRLLKFYESINSEFNAQYVKKRMVQTYLKKRDYKTAAEMYQQIQHQKDSVNKKQFYAQINEFRTIYELDKAELEAQQRLTVIQRLRLTVAIFIISSVALLLIVALVIWNRNRIAEKNRALYRQINEQDRLAEKIEHFHGRDVSHTPEEKEQHVLLAQINEYLLRDRNFANPKMNIEKIADMMNVSASYLYQAIKGAKGDDKPQDYINTVRLEEARRLLKHTDKLVETISYECGYIDKSTFYRKFKNRYNITPAEYRKLGKTPSIQ